MAPIVAEKAAAAAGVRGTGVSRLDAASSWRVGLMAATGALAGFHLSQLVWGGFIFFLYGVIRLPELGSWRKSFYTAVALGYAAYAPHLMFLWTIFGAAAVVLWGILAVWLGIFVLLARGVRREWGVGALALLAPWLWLGTEYFRSELYYLRFSWLGVGHAFSSMPGVMGVTGLGVYGAGFVLMGVATLAAWLPFRRGVPVLLAGSLVLAGLGKLAFSRASDSARALNVAGVQLEFPAVHEVPAALDEVVGRHPNTDLIVLSEYTFLGPVPEEVLAWCRRTGRYLVVGGQDPIDNKRYYNTAFVVGPAGEVVFRQVKSVPIQFFQDGEAAPERQVWGSPWGRLGIAVCYDLSYRRVMDELVDAGAEGLIVPVMDVAEWGLQQRRLHGRVGPIRAAEYGIPVFRLCSSGISQVIDGNGRVLAAGSYPGSGEIVSGQMLLAGRGRVPWDAWLGPLSVMVVAGGVLALTGKRKKRGARRKNERERPTLNGQVLE